MLRHILTTAWRKLYHKKTNSIIHLTGLVLGISSCLVLTSYLVVETNFDRFHKNSERIYRINTDLEIPGQHLELSLCSGLVGPNLKQDFREIESFVRISKSQTGLSFQENKQVYFEKEIIYADEDFFSLFGFKLIQGNPSRVLSDVHQVVLTKKLAQKYFGDKDPVGKNILIDKVPFVVSGLAADPPPNSHIRFEAILSYKSWLAKFPYTETNWTWFPATTYIKLNSEDNAQKLSAQINPWLKSKLGEQGGEEKLLLSIQPLTQIHLGPSRLGDLAAVGSKTQLYLLLSTAIFILLIAIFNYINLATAETIDREKEIGVRKVIGAGKKQIILQYLAESLLIFGIAALFSVILSKFLLPAFGQQVDQPLNINLFSVKSLILTLVVVVLLLAPLTGIYPALLLSRLRAAALLKQQGWINPGKFSLKKILITVQFVVSTGLIISTLVIWQQHHYLETKSMGFNRENRMVIRLGNTGNLARSPESIKQELERLPGVESVSLSSHVPGEHAHGVATMVKKSDGTEANAELELNLVDFDYFVQYGLKLIAGREFSPDFTSDTIGALIVNETALHQLGFSNSSDILGRDFSQWGREGKVIGVVKDFNQHTLQNSISAVTFQVNPALFEKITIGYKAGSTSFILGEIQKKWNQIAGEVPLDYVFLDDWLRNQYNHEKQFSNLFIGFTILAIIIACLGIYGLTKSAINKRIKEIGIRKVLGSSIFNIVKLFTNEIAVLSLIGLLIATPITWWLVSHWLDQFAYRINISWTVFVVAGLLVSGVTLLTAGLLVIRASINNPVRSLRNE